MARYARVQNGQVLEYRDLTDPPPAPAALHAGKPYFLPFVSVGADFDPVAEVREGPAFVVQREQVTEVYTVRPKTAGEIAVMRVDKQDTIEAEFQRLCNLPMPFEVGGVQYDWHADADSIRRIMGVLAAYGEAERLGIDLPDPRELTPVGSLTPVTITRAEIAGLGLAIAGREDVLFRKKKQKQAQVAAMTDAHDIDAVDPVEGWD